MKAAELAGKIRAVAYSALSPYLRRHDRVIAALSGGLDSVGLLHMLRASPDLFAAGRTLAAAHVNHRIGGAAQTREAFCRALCAEWEIPFYCAALPAPPRSEEEARRLRYRTLAGFGADVVVCAHHADDQIETALFRLLRGAGVRGLAAMAACAPLPEEPAIRLVRPLLQIARADLRAYADAAKLRWMEDDDNANLARRRNFIRRRLLPLAESSMPAARAGIRHTLSRAADAAELLGQLAAADQSHAAKEAEAAAIKAANLRAITNAGAAANAVPATAASYWRRVGEARTRNWLAATLRRCGAPRAATRHIAEAARQICQARKGAQARFSFGDGVRLSARRGVLYWSINNAKPAAGLRR